MNENTTTQHLLVAVSGSPNSRYLIQWTNRMANDMGADWTALHVVDPQKSKPRKINDSLEANLQIAQSLGAHIVTLYSSDIAGEIIRYSKKHNITHIISGKSGPSEQRSLFRNKSISEKIIDQSGDLDILFLQEQGNNTNIHQSTKVPQKTYPNIVYYLFGIIVLSIVTVINTIVFPVIGYEAVSLLYLLTIMVLALILQRGPIIFSTISTVMLWNFFFIPPRFTFSVNLYRDIIMLGMYLITATIIGVLTSRIRESQRKLVHRQTHLTFLSDFSLQLSEKRSIDDIVNLGLELLSQHFDADILILLKMADGSLTKVPKSYTAVKNKMILQKWDFSWNTAQWCYTNNGPSGKFTSMDPDSPFHFIPLTTSDSVLGVLGVRPKDQGRIWNNEQLDLLSTLNRTIALTLEREYLYKQNRVMELQTESERLGKILLSSISHELRTPLTTIKGSISALLDEHTVKDDHVRSELLHETLLASDTLNLLVENILSMSRLESGSITLKRTTVEVSDFLASVYDSVKKELNNHTLTISHSIPDVLIEIDFVLMVQVLTNIIRNSLKHSGTLEPILVSVRLIERDLIITVNDLGSGVSKDDLPKVFDKFFRGSNSHNTTGTGLGLSICKGIVEAHGGTIRAENTNPGFSIGITLPNCLSTGDIAS